MLDSDTKRRIDTARDILVGKVPDPKSQVEQITIALIYKFMDDMDAESEEFGGERSFFAGEFARYGWTKLMRAGLGGHETLNLYAESITKMPENPGVPPFVSRHLQQRLPALSRSRRPYAPFSRSSTSSPTITPSALETPSSICSRSSDRRGMPGSSAPRAISSTSSSPSSTRRKARRCWTPRAAPPGS